MYSSSLDLSPQLDICISSCLLGMSIWICNKKLTFNINAQNQTLDLSPHPHPHLFLTDFPIVVNVSSILAVTQTKHLKSLTPLFPYIIFNLLASCWLYLHYLFRILSFFTTSIIICLVQTTTTLCLDFQ